MFCAWGVKKLMRPALGVLVLAGISLNANAVPVLTLTIVENGNSITVEDNGAGDSNPEIDNIAVFNPDPAYTGPGIGSTFVDGQIDITASGTLGGNSNLMITAFKDFSNPDPLGAVQGSLAVNNVNDAPFIATQTITVSPFGSSTPVLGSNEVSTSDPLSVHSFKVVVDPVATGGYRLSNSLDISTTSSASVSLIVGGQSRVPEPASLALLGAGLLAFGAVRRKRS